MTSIKYDIKCPKCNSKNRFKVNDELINPDFMNIIDRSIFKHTCKKCQQDIILEYPFKIETDNFIIYYTPIKNDELEDSDKRKYMRICDNFDDLKEKLLIFRENLNDIIIEYIKDFLSTQIDDSLQKDVTEIRFNGVDEKHLLFSLIGANQIIGIDKLFYNNVEKKMKLKVIKKCILVDKYTYSKYYKMGLLK